MTFDEIKKHYKINTVVYQTMNRSFRGAKTLLTMDSRRRKNRKYVSWSYTAGLCGQFVVPVLFCETETQPHPAQIHAVIY